MCSGKEYEVYIRNNRNRVKCTKKVRNDLFSSKIKTSSNVNLYQTATSYLACYRKIEVTITSQIYYVT